MEASVPDAGSSTTQQSTKSSYEVAYRQRIGLNSISTSAPSVAALSGRFRPQGVLLPSSHGADPARHSRTSMSQSLEHRTQAFLTASEGGNCAKHSAVVSQHGTDKNSMAIRSFARHPPIKEHSLYESRRFRQLYERDKHLRQLLLKDQLWDRQTVEQTFRATFMDKRLPTKT